MRTIHLILPCYPCWCMARMPTILRRFWLEPFRFRVAWKLGNPQPQVLIKRLAWACHAETHGKFQVIKDT
jgi:hypothetical protein